MLQVDLRQPREQIAEEITAQCSGVGNVVSVTVHGSPSGLAWVEMANHTQAIELAIRYGGTCVWNWGLIHLEPLPEKARAARQSA